MYQIFGVDIIDSKDIAVEIENKTVVKINADITKGTQREDAIGYRALINISELGYIKGTEFEQEEDMDILMGKADEFVEDSLREILPRTMDFTCLANSYDPVSEEVGLIIVIMHISNAERKLRDVLKRLLRI